MIKKWKKSYTLLYHVANKNIILLYMNCVRQEFFRNEWKESVISFYEGWIYFRYDGVVPFFSILITTLLSYYDTKGGETLTFNDRN